MPPPPVPAMVLDRAGAPLVARDLALPAPGPGELRLDVLACGVCRTDLHVCSGELPHAKLPLVLGHQVVGRVAEVGPGVHAFARDDRVGVPWLAWTCGACRFCASGRENLCDAARFTGYTVDGGFAKACVADARYCLPIPKHYGDAEAAPLLCAGLIGFRALRMTGDARRIGFYGFGASAHVLAQVALLQQREVFAFTRPGDRAGQDFARALGAVWAGGSDERPPQALDAAIVFAPVGALVPTALRAVDKGGTVVCAGIHMSEIPAMPYELLWEERSIRSVANLTRADGAEFMALAARTRLAPRVRTFALADANEALDRLRAGAIEGALVLVP